MFFKYISGSLCKQSPHTALEYLFLLSTPFFSGTRHPKHVSDFTANFINPPLIGSSAFSYAAAPLVALVITYATRSPNCGADPASRFLILSASSTCACFPA
ncbi:hypothetical protein AYI68_g2875 [Smittium mucronatum]|uniref:Uncharacterized protein n=1 Tax=Smittium mucronatum TaxID=133383 RepID=A0A1R0H1H3_9FUNG|nr:hypothetical protein AYI68_g2875 [Smittium mucronatum]